MGWLKYRVMGPESGSSEPTGGSFSTTAGGKGCGVGVGLGVAVAVAVGGGGVAVGRPMVGKEQAKVKATNSNGSQKRPLSFRGGTTGYSPVTF